MNHLDWKEKTILIAEDEKINYLFMRALFAPTGAEILWASSGDQAIDICRTSNHVDLVLMDRMMLDRAGKEATEQIKVVSPDLPIIGQTSVSRKNDREEAYRAGCDCFLNKPVKPGNLLAVVNQFLNGKLKVKS